MSPDLHYMKLMDLLKALIVYLRITPADATSARALYATYLTAAWTWLLRTGKFLTVGQFLARDIYVKYHGMTVFARAHAEDLSLYAHTSKPWTFLWFNPRCDETVVDCGSSVGPFTLLALQAGARVFAFEPNPPTFAVLQRNVALNHFGEATLINKGLGARKGKLPLYARWNLTTTTSYIRNWEDWIKQHDEIVEMESSVTTLDSELSNVHHIHWLLIDVEGFELQLLVGAEELLKRVDHVIIEVSHSSREAVLELLRLAGFSERARGSHERVVQYFLFQRLQPSSD